MEFLHDLRRLKTKEDLLKFLDVDEQTYKSVISFCYDDYLSALKQPPRDSGTFYLPAPIYLKHSIPKKDPFRGYREVWELEPFLKNIFKTLSRRLAVFFETVITDFPHERATGYIKGRNIRNNAYFHIGARTLIKCDIKNFFPSITRDRVAKFFYSLQVEPEIASHLAEFLTINDELALGLPTSPIIANAVCHHLDIAFVSLAEKTGSSYSRYADDITFSSHNTLPTINEIEDVLNRHNFNLETTKTRKTKRGQNHYVTGLSISDSKAPHAPRRMKKKLRQELYYSAKFGLTEHASSLGIISETELQRHINRLDGMVKYVAFHEPSHAKKILPLWRQILSEAGAHPSFAPKNQDEEGFQFYIDETEFNLNGVQYLALGFSATQHQELLDAVTKHTLERFLADPYSDGKLEALERNGLHFSDSLDNLKIKYVQALQELPFNGYIVYGMLGKTAEYQAVYLKLLKHVIRRRLISAESRWATFSFEENNKINKRHLEEVVIGEWRKLRDERNRHPIQVSVNFVSKENAGVSVPDFLLGAFRKYLEAGPLTSPPRKEHILFERLRDKIRVIVNADTDTEFTRRNAFQNDDQKLS